MNTVAFVHAFSRPKGILFVIPPSLPTNRDGFSRRDGAFLAGFLDARGYLVVLCRLNKFRLAQRYSAALPTAANPTGVVRLISAEPVPAEKWLTMRLVKWRRAITLEVNNQARRRARLVCTINQTFYFVNNVKHFSS
ncbi:unnamed protein product [Protopolystoma xenopodis]|uniref:Uncharacterized protein n=1 Tax=Protopolystoma xenopodis TaxID=117903 RepID=A0A448X8F8_9PLAT|nr:unnamed protein product [Protopolystoma xenopodis]